MLFLYALGLFAQPNVSLCRFNSESLEKILNARTNSSHTSLKPYIPALLKMDSIGCKSSVAYRGCFLRKLKQESLIVVDTASLYLTIDPLFDLQYGKDITHPDSHYYNNTRGFLVRGSIGKNFSFESSFLENQSVFAPYLDSFVRKYGIVPGLGRVKSFKQKGFDYAMASGYVSYSLKRKLNIQLGHGKHFIGEGYRSLLLSDNAFNYPYFRATFNSGKIQYAHILASLQVMEGQKIYEQLLNEPVFLKKAASFHLMSWMPLQNWEMAFFQSIIWQTNDSLHSAFNWNSLNPVIYFAAFQYGLRHNNNVLLGYTTKWKATHTLSVYGSIVVDDLSLSSKKSTHNKWGYQLGFKAFDIFGLQNLSVQSEYNQVQPYTYSHSYPSQSYTHYNQALAHPLGGNFREWVSFLQYRFHDFFAEIKFNFAVYGADTANSHVGKELLFSEEHSSYGRNTLQFIPQGLRTQLMHKEMKIGYLVNPATNMNFSIGFSFRQLKNARESNRIPFVYVAFRTLLYNSYYDF